MATSSEGEEGDVAGNSRDDRLASSGKSTDSVFDNLLLSGGSLSQVGIPTFSYNVWHRAVGASPVGPILAGLSFKALPSPVDDCLKLPVEGIGD